MAMLFPDEHNYIFIDPLLAVIPIICLSYKRLQLEFQHNVDANKRTHGDVCG